MTRADWRTFVVGFFCGLAVSIGALVMREAGLAAKRDARCGRRCGVALGVLGTVSAAVAAQQLRRATGG